MTINAETGEVTVRNFAEASRVLTHMHTRLIEVETTTAIVQRVWNFLRWATPAMIIALVSGVSPDSLAGRALAWLTALSH